jgi:hypothetical protein
MAGWVGILWGPTQGLPLIASEGTALGLPQPQGTGMQTGAQRALLQGMVLLFSGPPPSPNSLSFSTF